MAKNKKLPSFTDNFSDWYQEVIYRAELAEHAPVKGCMTIRPYGYALWENMRDDLDARIKQHGAKNALFPLFIPESFLAREKDHVEGFSPEIAVVTYAGGAELPENLIVRPTSETIIHESMKRWIQSYRDLPLKVNQWCNVVRWEKHPRLFLRTTEFQWQEGHTAHQTEEEAHQEVATMIRVYADFARETLAIPVVVGKKSEKEKFAGAVESYSIEGLMPDGRALQMGTAHYLGDNFSKMAGVSFLDKDEKTKFVQMTSWGVSTRLIGALIMAHGDEKGLVLPPKVAPTKVAIIPISETVLDYTKDIQSDLIKAGISTELDDRDDLRPGAKFYDQEVRGVPIRLEIGEQEVSNQQITYALRFNSLKGQINRVDIVKEIQQLLDKIQEEMLVKAEADLKKRIFETNDKAEFKKIIKTQAGLAQINWCGETDCELSIKEATGAMSRNMPIDQQHKTSGTCVWCGRPAKCVASFSKAY